MHTPIAESLTIFNPWPYKGYNPLIAIQIALAGEAHKIWGEQLRVIKLDNALAEGVGFEPTCQANPDQLISSQRRYDRFGTLPFFNSLAPLHYAFFESPLPQFGVCAQLKRPIHRLNHVMLQPLSLLASGLQ